ncbi:MAG: hypothetical protein Q8N47_28105 [Bryobacterales bacterium]|nr:hypothetical protein [Bryobacterales bacterium]
MKTVPIIVLMCAFSVAGIAQTEEPLDVNGKLRYHAAKTFGPGSIAVSGVKAGYLQMTDSPTEWGQGASGYSRRVVSSVASSGIRSVLAFGLDSALHQDPRYFRSDSTGIWPRTAHALRGTILTRTDSGGETLSIWRLGSAYGAAFISNQWYPDRLNTTRHALVGGSTRLGFDVAKNVLAEFWPDIKKKISRRKP